MPETADGLTFTLRAFRREDAAALAALFFSSVHEVGSRDYTFEQVAAWAPKPLSPETYIEKAADGRLFLVAEDEEGRLLAYGDLEPDGHIDHLYAHPDAVGRGVASALYAALEAHARAKGMARLYVEASEAAKRLFERRGFTVVKRRDFDLRGTAIHNYAMEKRLAA